MTKSTRNQQQYAKAVLALANVPPNSPLGTMHKDWWQNPLNPTSFRLTKTGYYWFASIAKIAGHTIELEEKIMPKHLLQLEKLFSEPYYIENLKTIVVYSETDAVMLQLHSGDLATYLDNLESNI